MSAEEPRRDRRSNNSRSGAKAQPKKPGRCDQFSFGRPGEEWDDDEAEADADDGAQLPAVTVASRLPAAPNPRSAARQEVLSQAYGQHVVVEISAPTDSCAACGAAPPRVFRRCALCLMCHRCCVANAGMRCPGLANGGLLHEHALVYRLRTHEDRPPAGCEVGGPGCLCRRTMWACASGCSFEACDVCMKLPTAPDGYEKMGRRDLDSGPAFSAEAASSSAGAAASSSRDDWAEGSSLDVAAAEQRAATAWEQQEPAPSAAISFVGSGAVGEPVYDAAGRTPGGGGYPSQGYYTTTVTRPVVLDRQFSEQSGLALRSFASNAGASADITTAEEILVRNRRVDDRFLQREIRDAVAAGELGVAAQFLMGASLAQANAPQDGGAAEAAAAAPADLSLCPVCAEDVRGAVALGASVGCLVGHALHASCAADLALGGGTCPTCRAPLFYASAAVAKENAILARTAFAARDAREGSAGQQQQQAFPLNVGDHVWIQPEVERCRLLQAMPGAGGWQEEMARHCGTEGVVTEIVELPWAKAEECTHRVEVRSTSSLGHRATWAWHRALLVTVCAAGELAAIEEDEAERRLARDGNFYTRAEFVRFYGERRGLQAWEVAGVPEPDPSEVGAQHIARLRRELAVIEQSREDVRAMTAKELGLEAPEPVAFPVMTTVQEGVPSAPEPTDEAVPPPLPPAALARLQREVTASSQTTIGALGLTVSPADMQRARHLLALARQWSEPSSQSARAAVHSAVRGGDIDSAARLVRHHNLASRVHEALWADAAVKHARYRVVPGVRVELLAAPRRGSPRTGFILEPGEEFTSVAEVIHEDGVRFLRVGGAQKAVESASASMNRRRGIYDWDMPEMVGARVILDDGSGAIGRLLNVDGDDATVEWDGLDGEVLHVPVEGLVYAEERPYEGVLAPPMPQGWAQVRPGGPGSPSTVEQLSDSLRCFGCGGALMMPWGRRGGNAFAVIDGAKVKVGDRLLVSATLEPVVVCRIAECKVAHPSLRRELRRLQQPLLLCSFAGSASAPASGCSAPEVPEEDLFAFRPNDLVWPGVLPRKPLADASQAEEADEFRLARGVPLSRREVVLMLGLEAAKECWYQSGPEAEHPVISFASCVRGHYMHARCFQGRLISGRGCPVCPEALFVPSVARERAADDAACCAAQAAGADREQLQEAQQAIDQAATAPPDGAPALDSLAGRALKMCPVCCSGPLYNENCSDLSAHHGQCPHCNIYPYTAAQIAQVMVGAGTGSVGAKIPRCTRCNRAVFFNGCHECGHLFNSTSWDLLPEWDPKAKEQLEANQRYLRLVRLLAAQVREQAARLAHERAALEEAQAGGVPPDAALNFAEPPPEPKR